MNTALLKSKIVYNHDTQEKLATAIGLNIASINARINGKTEFRRSEIFAIKQRYHLTDDEVVQIFFTE